MTEEAHITILYLDDDAAGVRLVQRRLGRHGFEVDMALDGVTGMEKLRTGKYDVLVTDHDMPGMTGLDVIRELVQQDALPPTIMVTGLGDESMAVEALKLGVDDYMVKDVSGNYLELLPTVIGEVLSRKHLQKQRQQLEKALRDSEAWFRSVFEGSRDAVCIMNEESRFEDVNAAVSHLCGYTRDQLKQMFFRDIIDPEDFHLATLTFQRVMAGESSTIELSILHRDGHTVDVELNNTRIHIGGAPYLHIVMRDITERKRAQEALRQSEEKYRRLVETMRDGLLLVDEQGIIQFVNESLCSTLGRLRAELISHKMYEYVAQDSQPTLKHQFARRIKGESGSYELIWLDRKGHPIHFLMSASPINDQDGRFSGSLVVMTNITERKRMETLAEQQRQQLIHADKMVALGTLVSGVAHEINNPNNNIMLNSTLLLESWESIEPVLDHYHTEHDDFVVGGLPYTEMRDSIPELFAGIYDGSQRIKRIVSDLKDFARQDAAEMDQHIDVNASVQTALTLSAHLIKKSTSKMTVELGEALPVVIGNSQRLEQVLVNLLHNACQSLENRDKAVCVTTRFIPKEKQVEIRIKDEGYGMSEETIERIMDPFFTTRRDEGGTGLGLSVSAGIIEEHNGILRFDSARQKGTTAIIILPAHAAREVAIKGVYHS